MHRDAQLKNFLLTEDKSSVKLANFGFSKSALFDLTSPCGSMVYAAPEIHRGQAYDASVDVWSLGICMFMMLTKRSPWAGCSDTVMRAKITSGLVPVLPSEFSTEAKDLFGRMCALKSVDRIGLLRALKHPFFNPIIAPNTMERSPVWKKRAPEGISVTAVLSMGASVSPIQSARGRGVEVEVQGMPSTISPARAKYLVARPPILEGDDEE